MLTTFHSHSLFCDGNGNPEDYIKEAIKKDFDAIGISSHAPVSFETDWTMHPNKLSEYIKKVTELKKKYEKKIQVYLGLEADYYEGCTDWRKTPELDYTIGSVHFLYSNLLKRYMPLDGTIEELSETLQLVYQGNIRSLLTDYYENICKMVEKMPPNIIGHLDVIKKNNTNNSFFDESNSWYIDMIIDTLDCIKKTDCIVEVNTGGISRGYTKEMYPSDWILKEILNRNIPIILNSDTHHPSTIDAFYPQAIKKIKSIGFVSQRILYNDKWCDVPI